MADRELAIPTAMLAKKNFNSLRLRHRRVMALHLKGYTNSDIARTTHYSDGYISKVLCDERNRSTLEQAYAARISQLVPKALSALERNMECGEPGIEVRAADVALKVSGRYNDSGVAQHTAEDVIERIMEKISPDGTTTRAVERRITHVPMGKETSSETA